MAFRRKWIEPFKVDNLRLDPVEEGTETSGLPEEVFEEGDWVVLGDIEPEKPMDFDEFSTELYFAQEEILSKAFKILKRKLEQQGYEIELSDIPLFHATPAEKPRIWYIVKKHGKPIAYCDLTISEPDIYEIEERERPFAELSTVCLSLPQRRR